jgi:hypothetical protein
MTSTLTLDWAQKRTICTQSNNWTHLTHDYIRSLFVSHLSIINTSPKTTRFLLYSIPLTQFKPSHLLQLPEPFHPTVVCLLQSIDRCQYDALLHSRESAPSSFHTLPAMCQPLIFLDQVFLLLVTEMALFMLLVIPMPFTIRRRIFTYVFPGCCLQPHRQPEPRDQGRPLTWCPASFPRTLL